LTEDRVEWHLWNWARWYYASREKGTGYASRASGGFENYTTSRSGKDWETEYDEICKRQADATDAIIDGLQPTYKAAIYAKHLEGAWALPEASLALYYRAAVPLIGRGLDRRGVE
jgi:hypothetical protein